jgi:hypothetical protein
MLVNGPVAGDVVLGGLVIGAGEVGVTLGVFAGTGGVVLVTGLGVAT